MVPLICFLSESSSAILKEYNRMTISTVNTPEAAPEHQQISLEAAPRAGSTENRDAELERKIDALAHSPTGGNTTRLDFAVLCLTGIFVPAALLIWGW